MPSRTSAVLALAAILLATAGARRADADGGAHPYFDDHGTLAWYRSLPQAQRAARAEGKVVLIECGRRVCPQCNVLVSQVIADPRVAPEISRSAVGLALEVDELDAAVDGLFHDHLPNARMLPFVAFVTPDGEWITGFAGRTSVAGFLDHLSQARSAIRRPSGSATTLRAAPRPVKASPPIDVRPPAPSAPEPREAPVAAPVPSATASVVPAPTLTALGSPDGDSTVPSPTRLAPPPVAPRTRPLAEILASAEAGADAGRWGEVMASVREAKTGDLRVESLERRARRWAEDRLAAAAALGARGGFTEALGEIRKVAAEAIGDDVAVDAGRGIDAIRTARDIASLDRGSAGARIARVRARSDFAATRWARMFAE
jgi:hypothetical protein